MRVENSGNTQKNTDHLAMLFQLLLNEKHRLDNAKSQQEKTIRSVFVAQIKKEIDGEYKFLGMPSQSAIEIDDDQLLEELIG